MLAICCHDMRQNAFAAGALPRTPLEEHTELPQIDRAVARSSFSGSARKFGSLAGSSSKIRLTSPNVTSEELYSTICGFQKVHAPTPLAALYAEKKSLMLSITKLRPVCILLECNNTYAYHKGSIAA